MFDIQNGWLAESLIAVWITIIFSVIISAVLAFVIVWTKECVKRKFGRDEEAEE